MAKVIDITDKLDFDSNPKIAIKGKEYEVNADAETVLKIMGLFGDNDGMSAKDVMNAYNLIFSEKERNAIAKLKLQFSDFQTVVMTAVNLITGNEESQGE